MAVRQAHSHTIVYLGWIAYTDRMSGVPSVSLLDKSTALVATIAPPTRERRTFCGTSLTSSPGWRMLE